MAGSVDGDGDSEDGMAIFQEPDDYYPPEKQPTTATYQMINGTDLTLRLVGHNPLWGHLLWNAGRTTADYLSRNAEELIKNKTILELGAGAGLPSLISAIHLAKSVVVTDYPDPDLIENLDHNIQTHRELLPPLLNIYAEGFLWGESVAPLLAHIPQSDSGPVGFDVLVLADLLFNHSEHKKLLSSVRSALKKTADAHALLFFTPYRPWLLDKDLAFFDLAREDGFVVEKLFEHVMEKVMFEEDRGDEKLRRTVFCYRLKWP